METTRNDNVLRARADGQKAPTGAVLCHECKWPLKDTDQRHLCVVDGCDVALCTICWAAAPTCELCHRHMCEAHAKDLVGLLACTECAGNADVLMRHDATLKLAAEREIERHMLAMDRITERRVSLKVRLIEIGAVQVWAKGGE